jgi:hypothetical protein
MEALEERLVPVTSNYSAFAQTFPRHAGPTVLYLNFDGWANENVSAFQSTTAAGRDLDIQEVIYRTAEIFAPFDVQVERIRGNGAMSTANGNTTVFIGDDGDNGTGNANQERYYTPFDNSDYPQSALGFTHVPNSNGYDFAFVDPVLFSGGAIQSRTNLQIAQSIAHEAGHTFGLSHIRSVGADNPSDSSTVPAFSGTNPPEMMSYDSPNRLFADRTFNMTAANQTNSGVVYQSGIVPVWGDLVVLGIPILTTTMETQNSFTYLTAVLGANPGDDFANVADSSSVAHMSGLMPNVVVGTNRLGSIERQGDYDVFQFTPTTTQSLMVNAQRVPGNTVDPVLMVFEGSTLLNNGSNDNRTPSDYSSRITMTFTAGHTYRIVVGGKDGLSMGSYRFWLNVPTAANPDHSGPRVLSAVTQGGSVSHPLPTRFLVTFDEDVNPSTFTLSDVRFIDSAGTAIVPSSLTEVTGSYHRQWRVGIPILPDGTYTLRIGPNLNDFAGNLMNQDNDSVNGEAIQDRYTRSFSYFERDPFDPRWSNAAAGSSSSSAASSGVGSSAAASRQVGSAARQNLPPVYSRMASEQSPMQLRLPKHSQARSEALMDALGAGLADPQLDRFWMSFSKRR